MLIIMSKEEKNLGAFQSIMDILMDWVFKFFLLNKTLDQRFGAKLKKPGFIQNFAANFWHTTK